MKTLGKSWQEIWQKSAGGQTGNSPRVVRSVKEKLKLNNRVTLLDVGCGNGSLLENLPAKKKIGIDCSVKLLSEARKKGLCVRTAYAWDIPFEKSSFDRVLCYSVLHYMSREEASRAIKEMLRVCKKGGLVLVGYLPDAEKYRFGRHGYNLREFILSLLGVTRATYFEKSWFKSQGFKISTSANSKKRFDALLQKGEKYD